MNQNLKKKSLGRGLSALLDSGDGIETIAPSSSTVIQEGGTSLILIEHIEINPFQPRSYFDEQSLNELTESIKHYGLIQPITVRRVSKNKYQLISGERRFKASTAAGLTEIPAYVRLADDVGMLEMALIENTHRQDLDAIEIGMGYRRLIDECQLTQEELSGKIGMDRTSVTNYLRLLKLPPVIQLAIRERKITMGHARALINIDDINARLNLFDKILDESLSVRDTEVKARETKGKSNTSAKNAGRGDNGKAGDGAIENDLSNLFHSNVKLSRSPKGRGKLIIPFKTEDELGKIISRLKS